MIQSLERRMDDVALRICHEFAIEIEAERLMQQFGLGKRVKKLKPGQTITLTIKRETELFEGVRMTIVDPQAQ